MNNYIVLPNDWYKNKELSNEAITVLLLVQKTYMHSKKKSITSINMMKEYMYVGSNNKRINTSLKNGLECLVNNGIITKITTLHGLKININQIKIGMFVSLELNLDLDGGNYYKIYENDLDKVLEYLHNKGKNVNKFGLIRYLISVYRVVSNQEKFGWLTQSSITKLCGASRTITRYNKILQDELNIFIYNNNYISNSKRCSTYFSFYNNKIEFNKRLANIVSEQKLLPIKSKK